MESVAIGWLVFFHKNDLVQFGLSLFISKKLFVIEIVYDALLLILVAIRSKTFYLFEEFWIESVLDLIFSKSLKALVQL